MRLALVGLVGLVGLAQMVGACSDELPGIAQTPPAPPAANDPAYTIAYDQWHLVGDALTPADNTLGQIVVSAPAGTRYIDAYVDGLAPFRLIESDQPGSFVAQGIDLTDLAVGSHPLLLAANGSATAFAQVSIERSYPYYVFVSTDWDFSDLGDTAMAFQDQLHANHPGMRITQFVGPYTFTDPMVTEERRQKIAAWALKEQTKFGDEIGLHIHPWCNFVTDAGLTCITDQSDVYAEGDTTGYTIKLFAYGRADLGKLLDHAADLFAKYGLPHPKTFRAGGWTASLDTLLALDDKGYVADTSALNWPYIVTWATQGNGELYTWNMANWAPINDTSQPYHPALDNELTPGTLPLLEVPDNGVMIDYTSLPQIEHIFDANFPAGAPLAKPTTMMMGFHPSTGFNVIEYDRVNDFLTYVDAHLASAHTGPVVYTTLSDVVPVFPVTAN